MHVQQLEIGGFQLANGLYKWTKIKWVYLIAIAKYDIENFLLRSVQFQRTFY